MLAPKGHLEKQLCDCSSRPLTVPDTMEQAPTSPVSDVDYNVRLPLSRI